MTDIVDKALKIVGSPSGQSSSNDSPIEATSNPKRILVKGSGPGRVKGIIVPKHMWEGNEAGTISGMKEINAARARVYGSENRDPLTLGQIGKLHKQVLDEHFKKPVEQQIADEAEALNRLRAARHIGRTADTLDESEKTDTVLHEKDNDGAEYEPRTAKGVAGHALYTSGHGDNQKFHIINTCPGQTDGCGGGIDANGIVDTKKGTCFAPNAEAQYVGASVRRACHEQAKHDPAMSKDWILAHTGSLRNVANKSDKKKKTVLFRPNVVDETDVSSRHAINHLNAQRKESGLSLIIANSYGKTNELHDPENGYFVTHSNVGPKVKLGKSIRENIGRDKQRVRSTITATEAGGDDFKNEQGNLTPPKNSYMVTDVKRYSDMDKRMQKDIKYAKYWSTGRDVNRLSDEEMQEGPEGHYDGNGNPTTPDKAHYGHVTVNGSRYDYQKQHILHPRMVLTGFKKNKTTGEMTPQIVPTDSRFKDNKYLPPEEQRFRTKNGKLAGAILMTTPTESTSGIQHQSSFTHHMDEGHLAHARNNNGEYEIDNPEQQEAARGKEYVPPKEVKFYASGGAVGPDQLGEGESNEFPEQDFRIQAHNAHSHSHEDDLEFDDETQKHTHKHPKRASGNNLVDRAMRLVANLPTSKSGGPTILISGDKNVRNV